MAAVRIPPRLFLSPSFLLQSLSASKSPINFSLSHSPSPSPSPSPSRGGRGGGGGGGGAIARSMSSSSSSSGASSPAPYTTLSERATCEREIKKSKFIALASPVSDERSAMSFLSQVKDPRATHNCWAYKLGVQYRSNDDGEPSGTAGKPIYSAIVSSGLDMVMVVVIRYFGGIKLGTGGLVRAYGGVALECLKGAPTCYVKPKVQVGIEVQFELVGTIYHQLQHFHAEDIKQDYDTGKDDTTMVSFKVDYENLNSLGDAINSSCGRKIEFFKG